MQLNDESVSLFFKYRRMLIWRISIRRRRQPSCEWLLISWQGERWAVLSAEFANLAVSLSLFPILMPRATIKCAVVVAEGLRKTILCMRSEAPSVRQWGLTPARTKSSVAIRKNPAETAVIPASAWNFWGGAFNAAPISLNGHASIPASSKWYSLKYVIRNSRLHDGSFELRGVNW